MTRTPDELIRIGYQARRERRLEDARQVFAELIGLSREIGDQSRLAASLTGLGQIERDLRNTQGALQNYKEAVEICRGLADPQRLAHTMRHLADILREDGCIEAARPLFEETLKIYREHAETLSLDLANAIRGFALVRGAAGETEAARILWQEARTLYESVNVEAGVQESDWQIARLSSKQGSNRQI